MKRRRFGLLAGSSVLAMQAGQAEAQIAQTPSLGAGLTPMGSEVAGNADGSIPAWTGGMTSAPADVVAANYALELFPGEQPVVVIDASNMAQYAANLPASVQAMMTKYGFKIKVYPTHRTAAFPQYVYDNTALNLTRGKFTAEDPVGGRFGFTGAYGGFPFPVPNTANPLTAGAQIVWNHNCLYRPANYQSITYAYAVNNGQVALAASDKLSFQHSYYDTTGTPDTYGNLLLKEHVVYTAPDSLVGQELIVYAYTDPYKQPQVAWELLNGQGRVRRAPEVSFDTPSTATDGIAQYDEYNGFNGSLERYDWKYIGKQEMFIPYNNNALFAAAPEAAHQAHFLDPDLVRWEKHRCWVVEATLHPGERNVLAKRRLYIDEDTWTVGVADEYDGNLTLYKANILYFWARPDVPMVMWAQNTVHNLQTDDYCSTFGYWNAAKVNGMTILSEPFEDSIFDPNHMAASAQY